MPTSKPTTPPPQSPADRRAAESDLRTLITKFAPDHLPLVTAIRKSLRKRLPAAHEIIYEYRSWFVISFSPTAHGHQGILAIRGDADGIKLYFNQGNDLPDPEKLLKGSAQARFIEVESASTLVRPVVASLIDAAIARNKVPFPSAARGPVVALSAATKKVKKKAGTQRRGAEDAEARR
jgi:hypothetical protein